MPVARRVLFAGWSIVAKKADCLACFSNKTFVGLSSGECFAFLDSDDGSVFCVFSLGLTEICLRSVLSKVAWRFVFLGCVSV